MSNKNGVKGWHELNRPVPDPNEFIHEPEGPLTSQYCRLAIAYRDLCVDVGQFLVEHRAMRNQYHKRWKSMERKDARIGALNHRIRVQARELKLLRLKEKYWRSKCEAQQNIR